MTSDSSKINIVILTDCLGDITGGAEKQIFELAKRLPKDEFNVTVASMEAQGSTSSGLIESVGSQLKIFRIVRIYGWSGLKEGIKFMNFLRKNSIHTLVTYHFGSDIWGTFWGHLAGVPLIISNRRDMGFWRNIHHIRTYKLINGWVNKIVVVSDSIKKMILQTETVKEEKIQIIYNGVEIPQIKGDLDQKKSELNLNSNDLVIMHVANLRPVKGHRYLIEAFAPVVSQFPDAKLLLIGKDELNGSLESLAQKLGIANNVLFLGQRTDVSDLLMIADICVLPSLSEGLSNAILEYMAYAKPVIATNVGGNPELIENGYNGILVERENTLQLTQALIELLKDKEKRIMMGENGLALIRTKFSMKSMMDNYQRILKA
jgi:glycosyltransferase involved in cell wall biosynthesis